MSAPAATTRPEGRGRTARGASAAIISQGVVAASSLVLQVLALRDLGKPGLANFSILSNGLIVTAAALHTGWVGDSLVILDRHEPTIRRALFRASAVSAVASLLFGFVGGAAFAQLDVGSASLFGVALCLWLVEETGRRVMMARHEFVHLVVNDVVFAVGSLGVTFLVRGTGRLTMDWLIASLAIGSVMSIVAAVVQLPREELRRPTPGPAAMRELAAFSTWRSGQLTMRPLGMLLSRIAVATLVSRSALGLLEAGRLLIAPMLTAANGFGGFSLPFFTRRRDEGRLTMSLVYRFAAVSAAGAALYFPVGLLLEPVISSLSDGIDIPTTLILTWCVYSVAYSANVPIVNALTSLRHSRTVFWGRCVDSVIIVVLSAVAVEVGGVELVPLAMTVGMVVGTAIPLTRLARRGQLPGRATAAPPTAPATPA